MQNDKQILEKMLLYAQRVADNTVWQGNMRSFVVAVIFAIVHG